ncbi:DUF4386 domain-containing protein [Georgenia sp. Z1491]|uniref:DUF4386 domain-containing protein n=1 Tax=Georgenia sp. Z1491 TaxID=3416707 RepID=UPI003CFBAABD
MPSRTPPPPAFEPLVSIEPSLSHAPDHAVAPARTAPTTPTAPTTRTATAATAARTARAALTAAAALTAMAVLAPLAAFVALPDGRTTTAGAIMLAVAVLDVVVALALLPVLAPAGRTLSRTAAALRLGYGIALGIAAVQLAVTADAGRFDRTWEAALGVFGLSLVAVGVLLWRLAGAPRWLGALVVVAGVGYVVDAVVAQAGPPDAFEVSTVSFVGEVALIVWLVVRGLRGLRDLRGGRTRHGHAGTDVEPEERRASTRRSDVPSTP